jgi:hypothetical protein
MSKSETIKAGGSMRKADRAGKAKSGLTGKTKLAIAAGAVVVAVAGLIIVAQPGPGTAAPAAAAAESGSANTGSGGYLAAVRKKYDFGTISMARGKVSYRYAVRNVGTDPVEVRKLYTSCMCTTAALVKNGKVSDAYGMPGHAPIPTINIPISPQEQAYVEVVFDPAAHGPAGVGPIERVVTVENSGGDPIELQFSALVTP